MLSRMSKIETQKVTKDTGALKSIHCHHNHTTVDLFLSILPRTFLKKHMLAFE